MSQIYLTLPSNSSGSYFPNNTLTNFKTHLQKPLRLEHGEWEVGLSEIQYPRSWMTLRSLEETQIDILERKHWDPHKEDWDQDLTMTVYLHRGYYAGAADLVTELNKKLSGKATFQWIQEKRQVMAANAKGFVVRLSDTVTKLLGLPWRTFYTCHRTAGEPLVNIKRDLESLFVYCDLVEHQIVGDTMVPLLRIVPVRGKMGDYVTKTYENVHYVPASGGHVQTVEIDIRDDSGRPIPFESGRVIVVLHLRKVSQPYLHV